MSNEPSAEERDKARKHVIRQMHLWDEGDHAYLFNAGWDAAILAMQAPAMEGREKLRTLRRLAECSGHGLYVEILDEVLATPTPAEALPAQDMGAPLRDGLSQQAAEPEVSALRASIPSADEDRQIAFDLLAQALTHIKRLPNNDAARQLLMDTYTAVADTGL